MERMSDVIRETKILVQITPSLQAGEFAMTIDGCGQDRGVWNFLELAMQVHKYKFTFIVLYPFL